ncbi:glycoside hydrolase family 15 protein [Actinopolymorpha alba]|uniref:glycoside hydrolase family 15 protein n=1 Tax=Actinopolymorpha alba TaxID=533267 RepID=UPI00036813B7|nr:glycoside hydrolase family 15 protein [Actinopolymorpha alba]
MGAPIEDYAIIGDMQTVALVSRSGSIDWLCLPRFDSGACFAALLGTLENGHWRIAPRGGTGRATRRRYRGDTLILETEWDTPDGSVRVIDLMPPRDEAPDVVRIVEGISGRVPMQSVLRLRFDYGSVIPWVRRVDHQIAAVAGPDSVWLRSDVPSHGRDFATYSDFEVGPNDRVRFVLTWSPSHLPPPSPVIAELALSQTEAIWNDWSEQCWYSGKWREPVLRSLLTLKALTYDPTGGIVAAPTTSLPEDLGGVRNWDYRFCWLRDATMTLAALIRSGYTQEASAWRQWLLRAIAGSAPDLQNVYGVAGERRMPEYELPWLPGYEGSVPVRIGNGAVDQLQLDVYGEVIDALAVARGPLGIHKESWSLQCVLINHLIKHWGEPDEGIWEVRGARRPFTHSKVMAWVALDRAVRAVKRFGLSGPAAEWKAVRDEIHREVCAKGFDADRNTFTQYFGSRELDAALLLIPQVGFLPPSDPRVVGTVEAIERELTHDGLVLRYSTDTSDGENLDGLPGTEGAFLACTFWLADDLHLIGRPKDARALFERLLDLRNDVGLLAEEYDPRYGRMVGNFPQAYSHIALVNSALHLGGTESAVRCERD